MTRRRFYAAASGFGDGVATLDTEETRHLRDVLRLSVGDEIRIFNGEGQEYLCRIDSVTKSGTDASIVREIEPSAKESPLSITLASVAVPGDKYDLIVQKSVELGVVSFIPLASQRSEVKHKDLSKKLTRWRRIALDAAKQCGRARLMQIDEPREVNELLATTDEKTKIFFSERDGDKLPQLSSPKEMLVVIGPKGGWDDGEIETAKRNDFHIVTLGGRIMRAETAAIALTAILQHRFGDIN